MPKTATGKVQRGLVAKTMLDKEKLMRDDWKGLLNSEKALLGKDKCTQQLSSSVPHTLEPNFDSGNKSAAA